MIRALGRHLRTNVVAYLALFVALGGTAYAAATIGSAQVIDESLRSADLRDGAAVKSSDVVDDTAAGGGLAGADIRENTLGKVPRASRATVGGVFASQFAGPRRALGTGTGVSRANCPTGQVVTGGGYSIGRVVNGSSVFDRNVQVANSYAVDRNGNGEPDAWYVEAANFGPNPGTFVQAAAMCAVSSSSAAVASSPAPLKRPKTEQPAPSQSPPAR